MTPAASASPSSLVGRRVLVTRERPGELGALLTARGAEVLHVPLIAVTDPPDAGAALRRALDRLDRFDWLIVTSAAGAERVGERAHDHPAVRLAAVGTATARILADLAGRAVDVVPPKQIAAELATALLASAGLPPARMLVAQADLAADTLADALRGGGHDVEVVTAYSTVLVTPDVSRIGPVDALVLASGSAARSWVEATRNTPLAGVPDVIVAIGPTTADVAHQLGLKVSGVAADQTLKGLVEELERQFPSSDTI